MRKRGDELDIPPIHVPCLTYVLVLLYVFPRVRIAPVAVPLRCMPALVLSGRFLPLFLLAGGVLVSAACRQERARVCVLRSGGALF